MPLVACALAISGCASAQPYAEFAKAGTAYSGALDKLLVAAGNVQLDKTSETLISLHDVSPPKLEDVEKKNKLDEDRLKLIGDLRTHARLLAKYFAALADLATTDAPDRAAASTKTAFENLNNFSKSVSEFLKSFLELLQTLLLKAKFEVLNALLKVRSGDFGILNTGGGVSNFIIKTDQNTKKELFDIISRSFQGRNRAK